VCIVASYQIVACRHVFDVSPHLWIHLLMAPLAFVTFGCCFPFDFCFPCSSWLSPDRAPYYLDGTKTRR
jgi:hypothetical protein